MKIGREIWRTLRTSHRDIKCLATTLDQLIDRSMGYLCLLSHHKAQEQIHPSGCISLALWDRPSIMPSQPRVELLLIRYFWLTEHALDQGCVEVVRQYSSLELSSPAFPGIPPCCEACSCSPNVLFLARHPRSRVPDSRHCQDLGSVCQPPHPTSGLPLSGIRATQPAFHDTYRHCVTASKVSSNHLLHRNDENTPSDAKAWCEKVTRAAHAFRSTGRMRIR